MIDLKAALEEDTVNNNEHLRESMALSIEIIYAMLNKDYNFLETISSPKISVNHDSNSFTINNQKEQFLQNIDFSNIKYKLHNLSSINDAIVVVFGENDLDIELKFERDNEYYLLSSFVTH
ncbi:hypothetical protein AZF04_20105 [Alkalihalobacillus trypoxylicola]|uniref:Uncharacterized protein n=1 Tax=Alkalihalobacillus trypoxylicola TaxID=519424 RepID=A0A162DMR2_9BACI|nr:hypothetical protein AZF04_20105 [Alkalihalobacillus trypoxylicola]